MRYFVFFAVLFFYSCGENFMYDKTVEIPNHHWTYRDSLIFDFEIADTNKIYNLYLEINHDEAFAYQNIYVMTLTKFPNGMRPSQRLNIDLAEKSGQWKGEKSGKTWTHRVDLQEGAYFSQIGKYTLTLGQFMRQDSLPHINKVRFAIEETKLDKGKVEVKQGERPKEAQKKYLIR